MQKKFVVMLAAAITLAVSASSFAAVLNDEVTSVKLKEADGTSGQNTNSGSGVKTGHIQDGAVTDAKIAGPISAAKIQKVGRVVVVATSGGDYTSPIAAVNSITDASAANPYLVKVMPGVYNLGAASLVMKPYVYLEGSGESSVITSTIANADGQCFVGTVNMANNSTVKNISIKNIGTGGDTHFSAVVFSDATATLESANVYAGSDANYYNEVSAVCSRGAATNATLNNVNLEARSNAGNSDPLAVTDNSNMTVTNSRLIAVSADSNHVVDCHNFQGLPVEEIFSMATLTITNSYLEGKGAINNNEIIYGSGCKNITVANSTLVGSASDWTRGFTTSRDTTVINTQINAGLAIGFDVINGNTFKLFNSMIVGGQVSADLTNIKLFHNYDENGNPIPDHQ
jgi:pectin methylesterase-like acyl-CoA thioesterase